MLFYYLEETIELFIFFIWRLIKHKKYQKWNISVHYNEIKLCEHAS